MLRRHEMSDADWDRIKHLLPGRPGQHGGVANDNRRFINSVLWIARTGAPWRDLPERLGNWNSQWRRFDRWAKSSRFAAIAAAPAPERGNPTPCGQWKVPARAAQYRPH